MAETVDLGSTASAWGFESLRAHHFKSNATFGDAAANGRDAGTRVFF